MGNGLHVEHQPFCRAGGLPVKWGSFFIWSTVLTLPIFFLPKKKGVVIPGPETEGPDGPIVTEPSAPPVPFDPTDDVRK
jgi:hypothetical protein